MTRGERGIHGATEEEAGKIRSIEAESACHRLGVASRFAGLIDGEVSHDRKAYAILKALIAPLKPDILLAHWPIDTHPDHQATGILAQRLVAELENPCDLWFYPAMTGYQSLNFSPTHAIDISDPACQSAKSEALALHSSQNGTTLYTRYHRPMDEWHGTQTRVALAEAYARQDEALTSS